MTPTDLELIHRFVESGDPAAAGELVRRHQSAVRRFLRHLCGGDAASADDLAQETFLRALRSVANFRGASRLETWLLGIAYNQYRGRRRRRAADPVFVAEAPELPAPDALSDLQQDLGEALARLAGDERTAIVLAYQFGFSHSEIAASVGWPLGTVKTHLNRGKARLKTLLSSWNPQT